LPVLPDLQLALHLRLLNSEPVRKLPTRGSRYPASLAFELASEPSAHPSKLANLDAALRGIKVDPANFIIPPPEFEFKVLNANLMAPLSAVVIISVVRASFARQTASTTEEPI